MSTLGKVFRWLWPRHMAGQLVAVLLGALVLSQVATALMFADERMLALRGAEIREVATRAASIVRLITESPPSLHPQIVEVSSSPATRIWFADGPIVDPAAVTDEATARAPFDELVAEGAVDSVVVGLCDDGRPRWRRGDWGDRGRDDDDDDDHRYDGDRDEDDDDGYDHRGHENWFRCADGPPRLSASALLPDGRWLNIAVIMGPPIEGLQWAYLASIGLMAAAVAVVVIVMVRRITRPLGRLAVAADHLGRGEHIDAIPEQGPADVRRTTHAFNRMNERLQRFLADRTAMLAAIGHDLRTPITSLRLRAEFIEDEETREKVLQTLAEMQEMTEATLAFAREDAAGEKTRTVDLAALLESLCDDLAEIGLAVEMADDAPRTPYPCRPGALKRALRNLIENAATHGNRAHVSLAQTASGVIIAIEDEGPGIPAEDRARVFEPFVRLEASRNRETGGIGLGMAIARTVVRAHGGDIALGDAAGGGLRVEVTLPAV